MSLKDENFHYIRGREGLINWVWKSNHKEKIVKVDIKNEDMQNTKKKKKRERDGQES